MPGGYRGGIVGGSRPTFEVGFASGWFFRLGGFVWLRFPPSFFSSPSPPGSVLLPPSKRARAQEDMGGWGLPAAPPQPEVTVSQAITRTASQLYPTIPGRSRVWACSTSNAYACRRCPRKRVHLPQTLACGFATGCGSDRLHPSSGRTWRWRSSTSMSLTGSFLRPSGTRTNWARGNPGRSKWCYLRGSPPGTNSMPDSGGRCPGS